MPKPTRKHFSLMVLDDSPQGHQFWMTVASYLGSDIRYEPLATFDKGRRHIFELGGSAGVGILGEAWEQPIESETQPRLEFVTATSSDEILVSFHGVRWDAGTEQVRTGIAPFSDLSKAEAKRRIEARRREVAAAKDQVTTTVAPRAWESLVGISRSTVEAVFEQAGITVGLSADPEATVPPSALDDNPSGLVGSDAGLALDLGDARVKGPSGRVPPMGGTYIEGPLTDEDIEDQAMMRWIEEYVEQDLAKGVSPDVSPPAAKSKRNGSTDTATTPGHGSVSGVAMC